MPGYSFCPMGTVDADAVILNSPSKSFNIAGLQMANIICRDAETRRRLNRAININEVCDVNPFGVAATIAAYNQCEYWIDQLCVYLHQNYLTLKDYIAEHLPQARVIRLEGTYLVWLDIRALGFTSDEFTRRLLEKGKVLVNSGTMYGDTAGEGFISRLAKELE